MTAFTKLVTYACPSLVVEGGCSLLSPDGITHDTAGNVPAFAAL